MAIAQPDRRCCDGKVLALKPSVVARIVSVKLAVEDHALGWTFLIACTSIGAVWAMLYSMWTS